MDIFVEDYGYITVDEFNNDLQQYQQEKIDHQNTIGVPHPYLNMIFLISLLAMFYQGSKSN